MYNNIILKNNYKQSHIFLSFFYENIYDKMVNF